MTRPWAQTMPGHLRHEDRPDPEGLRHVPGVERPRPPEGDEGEVAGVVAALHRDGADRAHHVGDDDPDDPVCGPLRAVAELARDIRERFRRPLPVQGHAPAEEPARRQPPEQQVRVGDGRRGAAPAVAGRTGIGPRALRPDLEEAVAVEPRDRAAPGPHRLHVDAGEPDWKTGHGALKGDVRLEVPDQGDVRAGAPHVEGDEVAGAGAVPRVDRAHHPGGRAG